VYAVTFTCVGVEVGAGVGAAVAGAGVGAAVAGAGVGAGILLQVHATPFHEQEGAVELYATLPEQDDAPQQAVAQVEKSVQL